MSQSERILALLMDGQDHSTHEICERVYGSEHLGCARIGARVHDLRAKGHNIVGRKHPLIKTAYLYKLVKEEQGRLAL